LGVQQPWFQDFRISGIGLKRLFWRVKLDHKKVSISKWLFGVETGHGNAGHAWAANPPKPALVVESTNFADACQTVLPARVPVS
jgi:hypothetical protein